MKKILTVMLSIAIMTNMLIPVFATNSTKTVNREQARQAQYEIIEVYDELYEEYNHDKDIAMQKLLEMYPSLEIVDSATTQPSPLSMTDISLRDDQLVHDSDWNTYIYFGYWEWKYEPEGRVLSPYDVVGFYTQNSETMRPLDYFVYCYNASGTSIANYNTNSGTSSGPIVKGEDTAWGAAFWIDDRFIRSGRMVVPLDCVLGSNDKVMMKYDHSWTSLGFTGIGGSVSIGGAGFNVSWDSRVEHWESPVTSPGVKLPK